MTNTRWDFTGLKSYQQLNLHLDWRVLFLFFFLFFSKKKNALVLFPLLLHIWPCAWKTLARLWLLDVKKHFHRRWSSPALQHSAPTPLRPEGGGLSAFKIWGRHTTATLMLQEIAFWGFWCVLFVCLFRTEVKAGRKETDSRGGEWDRRRWEGRNCS